MRVLITFLAVIGFGSMIHAQSRLADAKFHEGSNLFINGNPQAALKAVNEGLKSEPANMKLQKLKKLLEEQKKEQERKEQEQKKQEQQKKDEQKKDQQNKDQQDKENEKQEQDKKDQEKKEQDKKKEKDDQEKEDQEQKEENEKKNKQDFDPDVKKKLEEMKMDPEKARMLLEAMRQQEIQYLQQQKRDDKRKRDTSKPDW